MLKPSQAPPPVLVGLRLSRAKYPRGATITSAFVKAFTSCLYVGATALNLKCEFVVTPCVFTQVSNNLSSRPKTVSSRYMWTQ